MFQGWSRVNSDQRHLFSCSFSERDALERSSRIMGLYLLVYLFLNLFLAEVLELNFK